MSLKELGCQGKEREWEQEEEWARGRYTIIGVIIF